MIRALSTMIANLDRFSSDDVLGFADRRDWIELVGALMPIAKSLLATSRLLAEKNEEIARLERKLR